MNPAFVDCAESPEDLVDRKVWVDLRRLLVVVTCDKPAISWMVNWWCGLVGLGFFNDSRDTPK